MKQELEQLKQAFLLAIQNVFSNEQLEQLRVEYIGRKGKLATLLKDLPTLEETLRKEVGQVANEVKQALEQGFLLAQNKLKEKEKAQVIEGEWLDITIPGKTPEGGHLHLTTQAIEEINSLFARLGFIRVRHPEVEWDLYAFESLNMPKTHPARDEWETFFVADGDNIMEGKHGKVVLTPHTSNGQVREMERKRLPIRMININKCYRRQSDVKHAPMFHQFEGLMIDKNVTIAELKGVLNFFAQSYFGEGRLTRLRPYHFRFTEPSFEIDVICDVCHGSAKINGQPCKLCKEGWLELGGAGMVHPNVLRAGGLNPDEYSGFAFGWGVERTMMMKSGINIDDIRLLYRNDLRFLKQF